MILFTSALVAHSRLVVLQHGLYGGAVNLAVLQDALAALGGDDVLVHSAEANQGRTRDGVVAGGRRLAQEVRDIVKSSGPGLRTISFVGNSLGGIYARYAVGVLHDASAGLVAGLAGLCSAPPQPGSTSTVHWHSKPRGSC